MFQKILLTLTIVALVWLIFRALKRAGQKNERNGASRAENARPVEDMVRCAVCGDFVLSGKRAPCGRVGCPGRL